jgi:hypothetical protein
MTGLGKKRSHRRGRRCAVAFVLLAAMVPLLADAPALPPLNDPPASQQLPGKFVWVDLVTPDIATARRFYEAMFGWSYQTHGGDRRQALRDCRSGRWPGSGRGAVPAIHRECRNSLEDTRYAYAHQKIVG